MKSQIGEPCLTQDEEQIPPEECRALVERILESVHFRRASRSREFLTFVAEHALNGSCTEIHEQEIGFRLFGRPANYDTSQDNIVRVNATELRKRIESYFAGEGSAETLVLEIPRGSYLPVFRRRLPQETHNLAVPSSTLIASSPLVDQRPASATHPIQQNAIQEPTWRRWLRPAFSSVVIVALGCACLVLLYQNRALRRSLHGWESKPALTAFWPPFLNSTQQTDIILADTSFALAQDIAGQSISLSDYLNRSFMQASHSPGLGPERREDLDLIASRNNGSFGDFRAASRIMAIDPVSGRFHLSFAREYSADAMKQHNTILIGSRKSNPWVDLFRDQLNFNIVYDTRLHRDYVRNRDPRTGEQSIYWVVMDPYAPRYSVVAFLPNPSNTGEAIIVAGTDSEATEAAGEFLTSEKSMELFRQKAHLSKFPYFEVLLRSTQLSGTSFNSEIVAWRTYPNLH
jgi:hypothetical protein